MTRYFTFLVFLIACTQAQATPINILGDSGDGEVHDTGMIEDVGAAGRVGTGGDAPLKDHSVLYLFELPALQASEFPIQAGMQFNLIDITGSPEFSADLYGLGWVAEPFALNPLWYWGDEDDDIRTGDDLGTNIGSNQIVKLQNDIMTSVSAGGVANTSTGTIETSTDANIQLSTFIQSLYDAGASGGDFAVFRLNADMEILTNSPTRGYTVSFADDAANSPVLTITPAPIPEPSTAWIVLTMLFAIVFKKIASIASIAS